MDEKSEEYLEMAQDLDGMDEDVTSWEANFLDSILTHLRNGGRLSPNRVNSLKDMYEKYFG